MNSKLKGPWVRLRAFFSSLRWRLSLAMMAVVLFTTVSIGWLLVYSFERDVDTFIRNLDPETRRIVERRLDDERAFEGSDTSLDAAPQLLIPLVAPLALGLVLAVVLAGRVARPLENVSRAARTFSKGQFDARVPLSDKQQRSAEETAELARNFNTMAASLESLEGERQATVAAIAHELRTPLAVLRGQLQAVHEGLIAMDPGRLEMLLGQVDVLSRLVDDLRTLSLAEAGRLTLEYDRVDLGGLAQRVAEALEPRARSRQVRLHVTAPQPVMVTCDPARLHQVIANLVDNSIRHVGAGGNVWISVETVAREAVTTVRDDGPGIPEALLERVFERFYRVERSRSRDLGGSGLGLSIVKAITELHQGSVHAANAAPGAVFTVRLPGTA